MRKPARLGLYDICSVAQKKSVFEILRCHLTVSMEIFHLKFQCEKPQRFYKNYLQILCDSACVTLRVILSPTNNLIILHGLLLVPVST